MPIVLAPLNETIIIRNVLVEEKVKKHLESLGVTPGREVTVLQITNGNVIIQIGNSRFAIDKNVAMKIMISHK